MGCSSKNGSAGFLLSGRGLSRLLQDVLQQQSAEESGKEHSAGGESGIGGILVLKAGVQVPLPGPHQGDEGAGEHQTGQLGAAGGYVPGEWVKAAVAGKKGHVSVSLSKRISWRFSRREGRKIRVEKIEK